MNVNTHSGEEYFGQELDSYYLNHNHHPVSTPFSIPIQNNIGTGNIIQCKKKSVVHLDSNPHITYFTTWNILHKKDTIQSIEFFFSEEDSYSSSKVERLSPPKQKFSTSVLFLKEEPKAKTYLSTLRFSFGEFGNNNEMEDMRPASATECQEEEDEELKQILLSRKSPESIDSGRETALSNVSHRMRHPTSESVESIPSSGGGTLDRKDPKGSNIITVIEENDANMQPKSQSGSLRKGSSKRSSLPSFMRKSKGSKGTTESNPSESPGSSAAGTPTTKPKLKKSIFSSSKKHSAKHLAPGEEQKLEHGATFIPLPTNPNLDGFTTSGSQSSLVSSTQDSASFSSFTPDPYAKSTKLGDREKPKSPTKKLSFMKSLTKKIKHGDESKAKEKPSVKPSSTKLSGTSVASEPRTLEQNPKKIMETDLVQLSTEPKRLEKKEKDNSNSTTISGELATAEKPINFNPPLTTEETMELEVQQTETPEENHQANTDFDLQSPTLLNQILQKAKTEAEEANVDENPESQQHSFEKDYDAKYVVPTVRKSVILPIGREIPLNHSNSPAQEEASSAPLDNEIPTTSSMNKNQFLSVTLRRADEAALDSESDRPVLEIRPEDEFRNSNILCGTDSITSEISQAQEILSKVSTEVSKRPLSSMISLNPSGSTNLVEDDNDASEVHYDLSRRRSSDFTDSFKKLEPFNFHLEAVPEGKRERLYKVLVVGELGTGKTSIIKRYVHQFFSNHYRATIGVDFALKVLKWDPETVVRLQLWDIAGQERFGSMTRVYYKEAVGAFIVFDVTRSATLEAVPKWKADLDSKVVLPDGRPIPTVLLANKSDQPKEGIAANREKMNEFVQQQGFSAWFETSAKENINIDESANFLVSKILEMDRWSQEPVSQDPDKVNIGGKNPKAGLPNNCAC